MVGRPAAASEREPLSFGYRAREESYDVIVIGGGIGGLSAAAFLSQSGQRVLVLEQGEGPGGDARGFRRGPYRFDPAVHAFPPRSPEACPLDQRSQLSASRGYQPAAALA
jgi:glycine/D-amino acid oxidase-like deaminating enzyme